MKRPDALRGLLDRRFLIGLCVGLIPWGCASVSFPYHFYDPQPASYQGRLLGPTLSDDLDFSVCAPEEGKPGSKCVILLAPEFFKLKEDYLDQQQKLIDCEKGVSSIGSASLKR